MIKLFLSYHVWLQKKKNFHRNHKNTAFNGLMVTQKYLNNRTRYDKIVPFCSAQNSESTDMSCLAWVKRVSVPPGGWELGQAGRPCCCWTAADTQKWCWHHTQGTSTVTHIIATRCTHSVDMHWLHTQVWSTPRLGQGSPSTLPLNMQLLDTQRQQVRWVELADPHTTPISHTTLNIANRKCMLKNELNITGGPQTWILTGISTKWPLHPQTCAGMSWWDQHPPSDSLSLPCSHSPPLPQDQKRLLQEC